MKKFVLIFLILLSLNSCSYNNVITSKQAMTTINNKYPIIFCFNWCSWDINYKYPGFDAFMVDSDNRIIYGVEKENGYIYQNADKIKNSDDFIEYLKYFKKENVTSDVIKELIDIINSLCKIDQVTSTNHTEFLIKSNDDYLSTVNIVDEGKNYIASLCETVNKHTSLKVNNVIDKENIDYTWSDKYQRKLYNN